MFEKILVAVDGSRYAGRAVEAAIDLAKRYQSQVFLLHVIRNLSLPREILEMISSGEVTQSRLELLQDSAEIILENAAEKFTAAGYTNVTTQYVIGSPTAAISACAEENNVGLIVIGARGISSEDENTLGGVARKLSNTSKISCLIVK